MERFIWQPDLDRSWIKIWVLLFPCLLILFNLLLLQLVDLFCDLNAKLIFLLPCVFDHIIDGQVRDAIAVRE